MSIQISVRSVWQQPDASLHIAGDVEIDAFSAYNLEYKPTGPLHYELFVQITEQFLSVAGTLDVIATTGCVRCLEDFPVSIHAPLDLMYFFKETQDDEGEPYPITDENAVIDVLPEIINAVISEAPFAPLHDDSCKGLCSKCGINLNTDTCECGDELDPTHPFAHLKDLITEESDED